VRPVLKQTTMIVKLSPNVGDIVAMAEAAIDGGADALTLINTVTAMAIDVQTRRPRLGRGTGGLSGPAIHPIAVRMVGQVYRSVARDADVPLIGLGRSSPAGAGGPRPRALGGAAGLQLDRAARGPGALVVNHRKRERFDWLLERVLDELPARLRSLLEEAPLVVEDRPSPALCAEMGVDPEEEADLLCGLHSGTPLTHRSVEHGHDLPEMIHLFREGIVAEAGGWTRWQDEEGTWLGGEARIEEEIRVTLLHEIGHHFGLEDEDLEGMGYG
jgi:predicted Zn-dependent protease with MMP-like domain